MRVGEGDSVPTWPLRDPLKPVTKSWNTEYRDSLVYIHPMDKHVTETSSVNDYPRSTTLKLFTVWWNSKTFHSLRKATTEFWNIQLCSKQNALLQCCRCRRDSHMFWQFWSFVCLIIPVARSATDHEKIKYKLYFTPCNRSTL